MLGQVHPGDSPEASTRQEAASRASLITWLKWGQLLLNGARLVRTNGGQAIEEGSHVFWVARTERNQPKIAHTPLGKDLIPLAYVLSPIPQLSLAHDEFLLQQ